MLIVWMCWGMRHARMAISSAATTSDVDARRCIITDEDTARQLDLDQFFDHVIVADFTGAGHLRKSEVWNWIPEGYSVYLFLDADTRVIGDVSLGFHKAMNYGVAIAPAAHYCLDYFWGFDRVMKITGVEPQGQMQYNSGVIFFTRTDEVERLFMKWNELAIQHGGLFDQPYLSLAMEMLDFQPYVLSPNYNYRGMSVPIIGDVRIWHSYGEVPANLNEEPDGWPMRSFGGGRLRRPGYVKRKVRKLLSRLVRRAKVFRP